MEMGTGLSPVTGHETLIYVVIGNGGGSMVASTAYRDGVPLYAVLANPA